MPSFAITRWCTPIPRPIKTVTFPGTTICDYRENPDPMEVISADMRRRGVDPHWLKTGPGIRSVELLDDRLVLTVETW